jgi:hypothetical protein
VRASRRPPGPAARAPSRAARARRPPRRDALVLRSATRPDHQRRSSRPRRPHENHKHSAPSTPLPRHPQICCYSAIKDLLNKTNVSPKQIGIVVTNCSLFNTTPSLSASVMNHFGMSGKVINYNLGGMGCSGEGGGSGAEWVCGCRGRAGRRGVACQAGSGREAPCPNRRSTLCRCRFESRPAAGVVAIDLARQMLQLYPNTYALVVSHENLTSNWWADCLSGRGPASLATPRPPHAVAHRVQPPRSTLPHHPPHPTPPHPTPPHPTPPHPTPPHPTPTQPNPTQPTPPHPTPPQPTPTHPTPKNYYIINRSGSGTVTHLAPELFQVRRPPSRCCQPWHPLGFAAGEIVGSCSPARPLPSSPPSKPLPAPGSRSAARSRPRWTPSRLAS